MSRHYGFTLIELVCVIVVIGILSAVAIPRFIDLRSNARSASILASAGAINSAALMVRMRLAVANIQASTNISTVNIGGGTLIDVRNGNAACTANGIAKVSGTSGDFVWHFGGGAQCTLYPNVGKAGGSHIYLANCGVVYSETAGATWTPNTSGC